MTITSIFPYFLLMGLYLLVCYALTRSSPFYRHLLENGGNSRYEPLDGIRGFLALGVFFSHGLVTYYWHVDGEWQNPPSAFYTTLAEISVGWFFMITAFLFWGKVLRSETPIGALQLYRGRNRRLTPMYVFSILLVLLIVAVRTDFELRVPPGELLLQIVSWFSYGFMGIPLLPDINGLKDTHAIQSVIWTLTFEWELYLLLPLFARLPMRTLTFVLLMSVTLFFGPPAVVAMCFAFGAITAWLAHNYDLESRLKGRSFDLLMVLLLVAIFTLFSRGHGLPQYTLAFLFFVLLVSGNDLFGILRSYTAKVLGAISYSLYLLHNIILNQVFHSYSKLQPIDGISPLTFWLLVGGSGMLTIVFSLWTYRLVEHYFYSTQADKKNLSQLNHVDS